MTVYPFKKPSRASGELQRYQCGHDRYLINYQLTWKHLKNATNNKRGAMMRRLEHRQCVSEIEKAQELCEIRHLKLA